MSKCPCLSTTNFYIELSMAYKVCCGQVCFQCLFEFDQRIDDVLFSVAGLELREDAAHGEHRANKFPGNSPEEGNSVPLEKPVMLLIVLERAMGFEPTTPTLARRGTRSELVFNRTFFVQNRPE